MGHLGRGIRSAGRRVVFLWVSVINPFRSEAEAFIIISTHPEGRSHWLERGIIEKARERFVVPITHVVVDLEREREEIHH